MFRTSLCRWWGRGVWHCARLAGLVAGGARVTVVAPAFLPEFAALPVTAVPRAFEPGDVAGVVLAFAATDQRSVNQAVAAAARARGIPVNVADAAAECDFHVPARFEHEGIQVALSTGGESPRLARRLREEISRALRTPRDDDGG
ncbi:MAG: bifunctional precorrin-2 dehydrogenase/sirohydrochlorin ferrochelatase [Acidobacteria bacterium]|nr:bifunctional precorrin-2 dehydrogenase/sirohydrochlorin ferrochelatase [Acidobacteriota bacterium]